MSKQAFSRIIVIAIALGLTILGVFDAGAATVTLPFSGFKVIETAVGTEGSQTGTLAGTVAVGDPVWGTLTYDTDTGKVITLNININNKILYSGPPASTYGNSVQVINNAPHDSFQAVVSHGSPLGNLALPPGVTNNLESLQAGIELFDSKGTLYSGTALPTTLNLGDFDSGRVHLWTWFPDLSGDGISQTAWRIFADFSPASTATPVPIMNGWWLVLSVLAGVGLLYRLRPSDR